MRPRNRPVRGGVWSPPRSGAYSPGNAGGGVLNGLWPLGTLTTFIEVPDDNSLSFGDGSSTDTAFSLAGWFQPEDFDLNRPLFSKRQDASPGNLEYLLRFSTTGKLLWLLADNTTSDTIFATADVASTAGELVSVVATYDGSGSNTGLTLYVKGVAVSITPSSSGSYVAMHNTASPFYIGADLPDGGGFANAFHGHIGRSMLCNTELTAAEALAFHNGATPASAISEWPNSGNKTNDVRDIIGSNDAAIQGTIPKSESVDGGVTYREQWSPVSLRLASFNSYNFAETTVTPKTTKYVAIEEHIQRVDADIVAFQEVQTAGRAIITSNLAPDNGYDEYLGSSGSFQPAVFSKTTMTVEETSMLSEFGGGSKELNRRPRYVEYSFGHSTKRVGVYCIHAWTFALASMDIANPEQDYERCLEMRRLLLDAASRRAANPDLEIVIIGDWNQDPIKITHTTSFASEITPASSTDSGVCVAGSDVSFPISDSLAQVAAAGFTVVDASNLDGDPDTLWATDPNAVITSEVSVDRFAISSGLTLVGAEVVDSEATQTGGLAKSGSALGTDSSRDASDHKMILMDLVFN